MQQEILRIVDDVREGKLTRRQLVSRLVGLAAVAAVGPIRTSAEPPVATFTASAIDHVALRVSDVGRSRDFYVRHLGLQPTGECDAHSCFLRCGPDFLALFRGAEPGLDHYAYRIPDYSASDAVERLRAAGLEPEREQNRVYFRDPDDIQVQVSP